MPKEEIDTGRAPTKAVQIAEAAERAAAGKDGNTAPRANDAERGSDGPGDQSSPDLPALTERSARGPAPKIDPDAAKAPVLGKSGRDDIVAKFRENRAAAEADVDAEMMDFNHTGMPAELTERTSRTPVVEEGDEEVPVTAQEEPEELAEGEEEFFVIKVRGKEIELTRAQLEALADKVDGGDGTVLQKAQKAAAGDDYLREAREILAEAKKIRDENLALRGSQSAIHPGAPTSTTKTEQAAATDETVAHPDDPFVKAVEAITFGQPEEAVRLLREAVTATTATQAKGTTEEAITAQQMRAQEERAARIGKAFEEANPELAKDEIARTVIIDRCVRLQREDLVKLCGTLDIDPAKVPTDAAGIQHWHKFYRAKSFDVRDPEVLLNKAKDDFLAWKGTGGTAAQAEPARGKPRVEISVDRRVRRATVQQQPSRAVTPKPAIRTQQPSTKTRADVVADMQAARAAQRAPAPKRNREAS